MIYLKERTFRYEILGKISHIIHIVPYRYSIPDKGIKNLHIKQPAAVFISRNLNGIKPSTHIRI